jgi:hypothetical protein
MSFKEIVDEVCGHILSMRSRSYSIFYFIVDSGEQETLEQIVPDMNCLTQFDLCLLVAAFLPSKIDPWHQN